MNKFSHKLLIIALTTHTFFSTTPSHSWKPMHYWPSYDIWLDKEAAKILWAVKESVDNMKELHKRIAQLNNEVPEILQEILEDLAETIASCRSIIKLSTQCGANIEKSSEERNKELKTTKENIDNLKHDLQILEQKLKDYKILRKKQKEEKKLREQRREIFYDALYDVIFGETKTQDPSMAKIFNEACNTSPIFRELFESIKTIPRIVHVFRAKTKQLEILFEELLEKREDWQEIIDQAIDLEYAIDDSYENTIPALPTVENTDDDKNNLK